MEGSTFSLDLLSTRKAASMRLRHCGLLQRPPVRMKVNLKGEGNSCVLSGGETILVDCVRSRTRILVEHKCGRTSGSARQYRLELGESSPCAFGERSILGRVRRAAWGKELHIDVPLSLG